VIADRQSVEKFADRAKRAGIDTVILYGKELNGHVVYPSRVAARRSCTALSITATVIYRRKN
jgi:hypothetical protein